MKILTGFLTLIFVLLFFYAVAMLATFAIGFTAGLFIKVLVVGFHAAWHLIPYT